MGKDKISERKLKKLTLQILESEDWTNEIIPVIKKQRGRMIQPLLSLLYNEDEVVKWRSVSSFGFLAAELVKDEIDKVKELIRKCVWTLTEESGGIAWGSPEVIGEILSQDKRLFKGFFDILMSYAVEVENGPDNYLEYTPLRKGVYWGIMRCSRAFPGEMLKRKEFLLAQLENEDDKHILTYLLLSFKFIGFKFDKSNPIQKFDAEEEQIGYFLDFDFKSSSLKDLALGLAN